MFSLIWSIRMLRQLEEVSGGKYEAAFHPGRGSDQGALCMYVPQAGPEDVLSACSGHHLVASGQISFVRKQKGETVIPSDFHHGEMAMGRGGRCVSPHSPP